MKNKTESKIIRVLETTWLIIAIASLIIGCYELYTSNFTSGHFFFLFTIAGAIMYLIRRNQRKKLEQ